MRGSEPFLPVRGKYPLVPRNLSLDAAPLVDRESLLPSPTLIVSILPFALFPNNVEGDPWGQLQTISLLYHKEDYT